ncbi:MAG: magnesium transporter CorA family protein [Dehalococcoidia bacterium]
MNRRTASATTWTAGGAPVFDVRWVASGMATAATWDDVPALLARDDGFVWIDVTRCDRDAAFSLERLVGLHPRALLECREGVSVPRFHVYEDHVFVAQHTLRPLNDGTLEPVQFNQFVGHRFLVTIHGPLSSHVSYHFGVDEIRPIVERLAAGRLRPATPGDLASAIVSGQIEAFEDLVSTIAQSVLTFERRSARESQGDADAMLDQLFRLRLNLGVIRSTTLNGRQLYQRMSDALAGASAESRRGVGELRDEFDRVLALTDSEKELLQDVLDLYQARLTNDLNATLRRFTSASVILVVCTLIAGIYGMNFERMPELGWQLGYPFALGTMAVSAAVLAYVFRRNRWL